MEYWTVIDDNGDNYMSDVLEIHKAEAGYAAANALPEVMSFGGGKVTKIFVETMDYKALCKTYKTTLQTIAAQNSGVPGSTKRSDCMAALAQAALNRNS